MSEYNRPLNQKFIFSISRRVICTCMLIFITMKMALKLLVPQMATGDPWPMVLSKRVHI
jgi:hypothetical protein